MKTAFYLLLIILFPSQFKAISQVEPNQAYIDKHCRKIKQLPDDSFYNGFITRHGANNKTRIYLKKGSFNRDSYVFIITRDSDSRQVVLTPKDIDGYSVNGNEFIKCTSIKGSVISYFFIRLVERGRIMLYEKESTPNDYEFAYYLYPPGYKLFYITPYTGNIQDMYKEGNLLASSDHLLDIKTNGIDEKFKKGFSILVKDCPELVNKILSGFYGINDIRKIIKEYNSRFM